MAGWHLPLETALTPSALYFTPPVDGTCDDRMRATKAWDISSGVRGRRDVCALRTARVLKILLCFMFLHAPAGAVSEWGPIRVGM